MTLTGPEWDYLIDNITIVEKRKIYHSSIIASSNPAIYLIGEHSMGVKLIGRISKIVDEFRSKEGREDNV